MTWSVDGTLRVWDTEKLKKNLHVVKLRNPAGGRHACTAGCYSPDAKKIVGGGSLFESSEFFITRIPIGSCCRCTSSKSVSASFCSSDKSSMPLQTVSMVVLHATKTKSGGRLRDSLLFENKPQPVPPTHPLLHSLPELFLYFVPRHSLATCIEICEWPKRRREISFDEQTVMWICLVASFKFCAQSTRWSSKHMIFSVHWLWFRIIASFDGTLQMWDAKRPLRPKIAKNAHEARTNTSSVFVAPDNHSLYSRGGDHTVKVWDLRKFKSPVKVCVCLAVVCHRFVFPVFLLNLIARR